MPTLYLVATPIGNLEDITLRALVVLRKVDFVLGEDTRTTKKLLDHYQINKPLISYHQHSQLKKINEIIKLLKDGKNLAFVSEAGTPGISDPGNQLINLALKQLDNLKIIPIPGPCALTTALSVSGFPTDKFIFLGFPPIKKKRKQFFEEIVQAKYTVIFYESPYRIMKTLNELRIMNQALRVMVGRELTKKFETIYRGTIEEVIEQIKNSPIKGEFVIVISSKCKAQNSNEW